VRDKKAEAKAIPKEEKETKDEKKAAKKD